MTSYTAGAAPSTKDTAMSTVGVHSDTRIHMCTHMHTETQMHTKKETHSCSCTCAHRHTLMLSCTNTLTCHAQVHTHTSLEFPVCLTRFHFRPFIPSVFVRTFGTSGRARFSSSPSSTKTSVWESFKQAPQSPETWLYEATFQHW